MYALAGALMALGIIFLIAAALNPVRIFPGLALIGLGLGVLVLRYRSERPKIREKFLESKVVRLAREKRGRLTLTDVVSDLNLPVDAAKKVLSSLERKGIAYLDFERMEDEGVEVYRFPGLSQRQES